jgi:hypothetical protein
VPDVDRKQIRKNFDDAVNMTAAEIEAWLKTAESKKVGFKKNGRGESVGHASGRRIIGILGKTAADLSDADYAHMRKVVGYVKRHRAQEPANIATSRWRYSLMNWGHDPLK